MRDLGHETAPEATHAQPAATDRAAAAAGWLLAAAALAACGWFATRVPAVAGGAAPSFAVPWVETLDVWLAFRLDGLSLVMALLVTGFGAGVAAYATRYLAGHAHRGRFVLYLALFMVSMLGLVTADDVVVLFVFWELTTVASFLLVGFDHASAKARRNAWQALLITGAGGRVLLAGLVLLIGAAGTSRLSEIVATPGLADHAAYPVILALVLLGAFTKSAQFPFHFWLPGAMAAPTPVSAYLHSATMVKAGVYLLARLHPALSGTDAWALSLSTVGGVTMLLAAFLALRQSDLKLALAYTSVMALGSLVMFLGAEAPIAIAAAVTFLIVHALYKCSLFLVVGAIDHETGTREIARLGGLWRTMPMTALAALLAAGSMAGFPPFLGFIGKELKYEGALAIAEEPWPLAGAAVLANALMVTLALVIVLRVVLGRPGDTPKRPHEAPVAMWLPPLSLALAGLAFGTFPDALGDLLVQPAVSAIAGSPQAVELKLWHGINVPLAMSLVTVGLGVAAFAAHRALARGIALIPAVADRGWDALMAGIASGFAGLARAMQPGSLRAYLSASLLALAAPPLAWLALSGGVALPVPDALDPAAAGAALLAARGALIAAVAERRMTAIGGLGAVGTGLAMLFVLYGAPDVAITQFLVDVLLVVLIAGVMAHLPELGPRRDHRAGAALVAAVVGASVAGLTLAATHGAFDGALAGEIVARSVPEAYGQNVVNVVLVDFRALDTFGEIVVVGAAAIAALALLRMRALSRRPM
ncbi:MAG: hydrogen gas-evolving membrane-bound hydrogenase subunit E [Paracoccaceae bacterium]